ncbi:MAG: DUF4230 domain-containing protein [Caldilinea sp. CFX5]|nr:DUF4230 domain-containing protein [Caldilinea sp. CFX5]
MIAEREAPVAQSRTTVQRWQWVGIGAIMLGLLVLLAPLGLLFTSRLPMAAQPATIAEPWPTAPATFVAPMLKAPVAPQRQPAALPVPEWRTLNHLTTIEYTASSIVMQERTADFEEFLRTVPWVGDTFLPTLGKDVVTDRLVLKAVGKVQLGVEMAQVADVQITGGTISLTLPQPKVIAVAILPEESQIFEQQHFWLLSQYAGMENAALEQARSQLQSEVAANQEMLRLTADMARMQLTNFLRKAGFTTVEITFRG